MVGAPSYDGCMSPADLALGAHVEQTDPIAEAEARRAPHVQFFLGDPQGYKGPEIRYAGGAAGLRADAEAAGVGLYVHSPYIVNVATTNNRIRIPSRKLLQQHMDAAAEIGARGLIVHGGHVNKDDDPAVGFDNWRKAIEATDLKIPLLIENTAGGDNAMARYLDRIKGVFDAVAAAQGIELDADPEELIDYAARPEVAYGHKASMLQDVEARRQTEVDYLNGGIAEFGRKLGVPTPAHDSIWALVKGVEAAWQQQ